MVTKAMQNNMLHLKLLDDEWEFEYTDHTRDIVRAIVIDDVGYYYFVRAERNDIFGEAILIETSGGGVEKGECHEDAIKRELLEELGADAEIICKVGVVEDYYNLIHRHNVNNYYLCRVKSFGDTNLTEDEIHSFHISTLRLSYDESIEEYKLRASTKLGRVIANRELPILEAAKRIIDSLK